MTLCACCGATMRSFARATVRGRYPAHYLRCERCGFVQVEAADWLTEAYAEAITPSDLGLVGRNLAFADISAGLLTWLGIRGRCIDDGGGYGLFVRLMRDRGFDFFRRDPFCDNLFARGFDVTDVAPFPAAAVTAFELLEHLQDPAAELARLSTLSRTILVSTVLMPAHLPQPGDWWYYGLEHGQHIAFYTVPALTALAQRSGLQLSSDGRQVHLFSERRIPPRLFRLLTRRPIARLIAASARRRSLLAADYGQRIGQSADQNGTLDAHRR